MKKYRKKDIQNINDINELHGPVVWYYYDGSVVKGNYYNNNEVGYWAIYDRNYKITSKTYHIL